MISKFLYQLIFVYFPYTVNILFFLVLSFFIPFFYTRKLKINYLNPIMIFSLFGIGLDLFRVILGPLVLIEQGVYNQYYQQALFVTNIWQLINCIMTVLLFQYAEKSRFINTIFDRFSISHVIQRIKKERVKTCLLALFLFLLISFILLATYSFSVTKWIASPRAGYQFHRTGAGSFYALYLFFLSVSFMLFAIYFKENLLYYIGIIAFCFLIFLLGSKGQFLYFFISLYTVLWFRKKKNLHWVLYFGIPVVIVFMLKIFGSKDIKKILTYFDYYKNSAMYFKMYNEGQIPLFWGKLSITNLWSLVPRGLYPNKPFIYGQLYLNELFYPGAAERTFTPAFGGPIMEFADFGYLGVIFFAVFDLGRIILVFGRYLLFKRYSFEEIKNNIPLLMLFLYLWAPSFLMFFGFPLNLILICCLLIMFGVLFRLNLNSNLLINRKS